MIAAILEALVLVFDLGHCSKWVSSHGRLVCAEVRLEASCGVEGWHEMAWIPVCVRGCGEEGAPTS